MCDASLRYGPCRDLRAQGVTAMAEQTSPPPDQASPSPDEIEAEIAETRAHLASTIDELTIRTRPREIMRRQKESVKAKLVESTHTPGGDLRVAVSYTHLRAHETDSYLVCRLLLEKKKKHQPLTQKKKKK